MLGGGDGSVVNFVKNPSLVSSMDIEWLTAACNSSFSVSNALFWFLQALHSHAHTHMRAHIHACMNMCISKLKFKNPYTDAKTSILCSRRVALLQNGWNVIYRLAQPASHFPLFSKRKLQNNCLVYITLYYIDMITGCRALHTCCSSV